MTGRPLGRHLALAAGAALVLGACSAPGAGTGSSAAPLTRTETPRSSTPTEGAASPPGTPSAPRRLRVRSAGFRLPTAVGREAVAGSGCSAVVAGGLVGGDSSISNAYRVDLHRGRVTQLPPLPVPVHDTAGGTAGRALVIGGGNSSEQSVVQGWDGNRWKIDGHLPRPRSDLVAATVDGQVIIAGGYDGTRPAEADILSSTDGHAWKVTGTLPVPVRYPASTVSDGAIWLFGGEAGGTLQTAIQRIDPSTGHARVAGRLAVRLGHAVAIAFGTRILIAGGRTGTNSPTDRMWWFDPQTSAISRAGRLPHPLADSAVAQCDAAGFILGGETPRMTDEVLRVTYN
ncbi:hypothetical protein [Nocardioides sp. CER19]|uniref:hypothetical protein n=1 Tax=Nocardioides sp. CER19 TaxID=3038538 RepID=UPI0024496472|nr:hypothetical protein [Nocardioides sp. CER19]MDH2414170.1 hypothetical protein [Nocardioides sp. CER19]